MSPRFPLLVLDILPDTLKDPERRRDLSPASQR